MTVHKRNPPFGALCGARRSDGDTTVDYWDAVKCADCLALKPAGAGDRTSFKHSHRVEGGDVDDVIG